jgi:peptide/nickel transport system permease protein
LGLAVLATLIGVAAGTLLGLIAAYRASWWDPLIMRTADVLLVFPAIVFALLILSVAGTNPYLVVFAVGLAHTPQVARVIRGAALDVTQRDFVKAAQIQGMPPRNVMLQEVLPNLVAPVMVELGLRLTYSIIFITGLSFIGLGEPPPAPDWGSMINENRIGLAINPWATFVPIIMIAIFAIGTNLFTDAIARVASGIEGRGERADESFMMSPAPIDTTPLTER